jgi:hypothetical protein
MVAHQVAVEELHGPRVLLGFAGLK